MSDMAENSRSSKIGKGANSLGPAIGKKRFPPPGLAWFREIFRAGASD
jgi:hypothetical protein